MTKMVNISTKKSVIFSHEINIVTFFKLSSFIFRWCKQ